MTDKETQQTQQQEELEIQFTGTYKFQNPVEFEGQKYAEVKYDLKALKSKDVMSCRSEATRLRGGQNINLMTDDVLHAVLFARAADLPAGFILEMGAADYAAWALAAQAFFANALSHLTQ